MEASRRRFIALRTGKSDCVERPAISERCTRFFPVSLNGEDLTTFVAGETVRGGTIMDLGRDNAFHRFEGFVLKAEVPDEVTLMKRLATITISAVVTVALFAGGWKASDINRAHARGTLAQRQHCAVIAKRFQRDQQEAFMPTDSVVLVDAGYSGSLDTCITTIELMPYKADHALEISVRDAISGKMFFMDLCGRMPCTSEDREKLIERARTEFSKLVAE